MAINSNCMSINCAIELNSYFIASIHRVETPHLHVENRNIMAMQDVIKPNQATQLKPNKLIQTNRTQPKQPNQNQTSPNKANQTQPDKNNIVQRARREDDTRK